MSNKKSSVSFAENERFAATVERQIKVLTQIWIREVHRDKQDARAMFAQGLYHRLALERDIRPSNIGKVENDQCSLSRPDKTHIDLTEDFRAKLCPPRISPLKKVYKPQRDLWSILFHRFHQIRI